MQLGDILASGCIRLPRGTGERGDSDTNMRFGFGFLLLVFWVTSCKLSHVLLLARWLFYYLGAAFQSRGWCGQCRGIDGAIVPPSMHESTSIDKETEMRHDISRVLDFGIGHPAYRIPPLPTCRILRQRHCDSGCYRYHFQESRSGRLIRSFVLKGLAWIKVNA